MNYLIYIIIGGLILIAILLWIMVRIRRKRKKNKEIEQETINDFDLAERRLQEQEQDGTNNPYEILWKIGRDKSRELRTRESEAKRTSEPIRTYHVIGQPKSIQPMDNAEVPGSNGSNLSNERDTGKDKKRDKPIRFSPI